MYSNSCCKIDGKGQSRILTNKEFNHVIETLPPQHQIRNKALLYLSFGQGLRVSEIASLKIGDITEPGGMLKHFFLLSCSKSKTPRIIYLNNTRLRIALEQYLYLRTLDPRTSYSPKHHVFLSNKLRPFSPNSLQQVFKKIFNDAGIYGASSHSGRRTYATNLSKKLGADLPLIACSLGHKDVSVTAQYVEYRRSTQRLARLSMAVI